MSPSQIQQTQALWKRLEHQATFQTQASSPLHSMNTKSHSDTEHAVTTRSDEL